MTAQLSRSLLPAQAHGVAGWKPVALVMLGVGWGANQFGSLLGAYRAQLHLSPSTVAGIFGVYALGLVPGLLLGGPAADRFGRRRLVLPFAAGSIAASALLMVGAATPVLLFVGRFAAGLVTGVVLAGGTAWVKELSSPPHDLTAASGSGARRAALAMTAGFGFGPLVAAVLAQWSPAPLVTAYVPHLIVMAVALVAVRQVPDTLPAGVRHGWSMRVRGVAHRDFVRIVAPVAPWVFGSATIGFAVLPGIVAPSLHGFATLYAGVVTGVVCVSGVLVQPVARRLGARNPKVVAAAGMTAVVIGLGIAATAAAMRQPVVALVAAAALGAGYGLCLVFGLTEVAHIAAPEDLAGLTAVFYVLTYVGFAAPYVLALLNHAVGMPQLITGAALLATVTLVAVVIEGARHPGAARAR